jgi:hypothetical protein
MKKQPRKLTLSRETLCQLNTEETGKVAAGGYTQAPVPCPLTAFTCPAPTNYTCPATRTPGCTLVPG